MKLKKSLLVLSTAFIASQSYAQYVLNRTSEQFKQTAVNTLIQQKLPSIFPTQKGMGFYVTVPETSYKSLQGVLDNESSMETNSPIIAIDYQHKEFSIGNKATGSGLRLLVVNAGNNTEAEREALSKNLAKSKLIQTGDVLLTFRPQWSRTIPYAHTQLGISHAGVAYIDQENGEDYVFNLDQPIDEEHSGSDRKSKLSSNHYRTTKFVHLIRTKITEEQRKNIKSWSLLARNQGLTNYGPGKKLAFNSDYNAPKYNQQSPNDLTFVGDVARFSLGKNLKSGSGFTLFCSEFVWSILSLRNCDPSDTGGIFSSNPYNASSPECATEIFKPMPAFTVQNLTGLSDGPSLIANQLTVTDQERAQLLTTLFEDDDKYDDEKNLAAVSMSRGHREVSKMLGTAGFFNGLQGFIFKPEMKEAIASQINPGFPANYSPTAFMVNALLPETDENKVFEYVGTIAFLSDKEYQTLKSAVGKK